MTLQNDSINKVRKYNRDALISMKDYFSSINDKLDEIFGNAEFKKFVEGTGKGNEMAKDLIKLYENLGRIRDSQESLYEYTENFLNRQQNEINN